jgi:hypothetical protein
MSPRDSRPTSPTPPVRESQWWPTPVAHPPAFAGISRTRDLFFSDVDSNGQVFRAQGLIASNQMPGASEAPA